MIAQEAGGSVMVSRDRTRRRRDERDLHWPTLLRHSRLEPRYMQTTTKVTIPSSSPSFIFLPIHPFIQEESSLDVQKPIAREFYDSIMRIYSSGLDE